MSPTVDEFKVFTEFPTIIAYTYAPTLAFDEGPTNDGWGVEPTDPPVPYIPPEDDVLVVEPDENDWSEPKETIPQMEHDQNVLIALGSVFGVMLLFSIVVAHQMLNNPDGCCAR